MAQADAKKRTIETGGADQRTVPAGSPSVCLTKPPPHRLCCAAAICNLLALSLGIVVLIGWIAQIRLLASVRSESVPMSASTAVLCALLGAVGILRCRRPSNAAVARLAFAAVFLTIAVSLLTLLPQWLEREIVVERWFAPRLGTLGSASIGRMSPLTALMLPCVGLALLLRSQPFASRRGCGEWACVLALAGFAVCLMVLLSYATDTPLFYGTATIPMPFTTAVGLALLNVGLLLVSDARAWLAYVLKAGANDSASAGWFARSPLAVFAFLFVGIAGVGLVYVRHEIATARQAEQDTLSAIADLKVRSLVRWRNERMIDAQEILSTPFLGQHVRDFLAHGGARAELLAWLESVRKYNQGLRVLLLDDQLRVRLAVPEDEVGLGPEARESAAEALRTRRPVMTDLHHDPNNKEIHLGLTVPLSASVFSETGDAASSEPVAVVLLQVSPDEQIFPEIRNWPTPSPTAETLLVRREGDEVVYLNELRHQTGTALMLRSRIDGRRSLPAAMAAQGMQGCVEGLDYRNVPVLAVLRSVPGTSWYVVAKVDLKEFYAPLQAHAWATGAVLLVLLIATALGVGLRQRRRDEQWLQRQLAAERERMQALEAAQRMQERYRVLFENSLDGILTLEPPEWKFTSANPAAVRMFGARDEAELKALTPWLLAPALQADGDSSEQNARKRIDAAMRDGSHAFEWVHKRADGREFAVSILLTRMEMEGRPFLQATLRDISEQKKMEQDLRAGEARMRAITDSARDAILMMDPQGRISYWNPAATHILGYAREEAMGRNLHELIAPERYMEAHRNAFPEFVRTGRGAAVGKTLELHARCRDGREIPVSLSLSAVQIGGCWHAVGVLRDISEQKRAEEALRQSNLELQKAIERANRMAMEAEKANLAKSQFLANMSHEIRTPMTAILGYADLIIESLDACAACSRQEAQAANRQRMEVIQRNGRHLLSLLNDILDLSKIEAGRMATESIACSPHEIVAQIISLASPQAQSKGLRFAVEFVGPIPETICTDPLRLRQIIFNLIGNAIKFTEQGGVTLQVRLADAADGPCLQFDVIDTGIGMTPEQASHVFRPFSQADDSMTRRFGGTGLGLSISKRLAQMLGGDVILVETGPERGTRFRATVSTGPLDGVRMIAGGANEEALALRREAKAASPPAGNAGGLEGLRILLVEDGEDNQRLIAHLLRKAGATVELAENGRIGLDKALEASQQGERFHVILTDMQMPEMDGYEMTRRLRSAGWRGPIIALTAHAMSQDRQRCLDAGCDDYAVKPIDRNALMETICKQVDRASTPAPAVPDVVTALGEPLPSELADDADMAELTEQFLNSLPARIEAMGQALRSQDFETLARTAHQLKGAAGGYGYPLITQAARELETSVKAREAVAALQRQVEALRALCEQAQAASSRRGADGGA